MKTGKELLSTLHPVEQKNWEEAVYLDPLNAKVRNRKEFLLTDSYPSLTEFLGSSFTWSDTLQGFEYWHLLSQK